MLLCAHLGDGLPTRSTQTACHAKQTSRQTILWSRKAWRDVARNPVAWNTGVSGVMPGQQTFQGRRDQRGESSLASWGLGRVLICRIEVLYLSVAFEVQLRALRQWWPYMHHRPTLGVLIS